MTSHMWNLIENDINNLIQKTETELTNLEKQAYSFKGKMWRINQALGINRHTQLYEQMIVTAS